MKCPYCSAPDTKVLDSRNLEEGCVLDVEENANLAKNDSQLLRQLNSPCPW